MEKRSRDRALSICQAYIRATPRYSLIKQLNNLGKLGQLVPLHKYTYNYICMSTFSRALPLHVARCGESRWTTVITSFLRFEKGKQTAIHSPYCVVDHESLDIPGSRVDKHWFAVRDTSLKTDRLITLAPLSRNCSLSVSPVTKTILNDLFLALQHPYICPIFDIDFLEYEGQNYVILVQPISQGSLKDLIYGVSNAE